MSVNEHHMLPLPAAGHTDAGGIGVPPPARSLRWEPCARVQGSVRWVGGGLCAASDLLKPVIGLSWS